MAKTKRANLKELKIGDIKNIYQSKKIQVKGNFKELVSDAQEKVKESLSKYSDYVNKGNQEIKKAFEQEGVNVTIFDYDLLEDDQNTGAVQTSSKRSLPDDWKSPYPYNYMAGMNIVDNQKQVYSYMANEMGLNDAAIAGIMGNIHNESLFNPRTSAMDVNGYRSNGLFCWNEGAYKAWAYGTTIDSQMNFMASTIKPSTLEKIRAVPDTPAGAQQAALIFAKEYEVCSSSSYGKRQSVAVQYYNSFK